MALQIPEDSLKNHKLARSITNINTVQFHMPLQLLKRALGPKDKSSTVWSNREENEEQEDVSFPIFSTSSEDHLNSGSSTFVAKQRQLRLG